LLLADDEENRKRTTKRIKAGDPAAMRDMGTILFREGDYDIAIKYWTKAAELGDVAAHYQLADTYREGDVVEKDEGKAIYHWKKAAIGGHPWARHVLALIEEAIGNMERAVKHFIIAANLGEEDSMKELWGHYAKGNITKEDLEATLRSHKAAIDEMKSSQREEAERFKHYKKEVENEAWTRNEE
jgi:TPR repeat protein